MTHLLDTNAYISHLRFGPRSKVTEKLSQANPGSVVLCSVVVAELLYGAHRSASPSQTLTQVQRFCQHFVSLPFDEPAAHEYGRIRAFLTTRGAQIGPNDLLIASIALANNITLVTHNTAEFSRVPSLRLDDWQ